MCNVKCTFPSGRGEDFNMTTATAKVEFIKDENKSAYAWTKDGPYCLVLTEQQYASLKPGQKVTVKYDKYGQYAMLAK